MTNSEMAAKYAAEHPIPIQEKCPVIIQWAKKADGYHYWFSPTGQAIISDTKRTSSSFDAEGAYPDRFSSGSCFCTSAGTRGYRARYTNYIDEYNCIEIAAIYMPGHVGKANEPRQWKFDDMGYNYRTDNVRLFMFKGDKHLYNQKGEVWQESGEGKYYNKNFKYFCQELSRLKGIQINEKEFQQFAGTKSFRVSYWSSSLGNPTAWQVYYEKSAPRPVSKTQENINNLTKLSLTPLNELEKKYPLVYNVKHYKDYYGNPRTEYEFEDKDFVHFEIASDEYCVIRYLSRPYNRWEYGETRELDPNFEEPTRIYINQNGKTTVCQYLNGQYKITSQQLKDLFGYYGKPKFGNMDEIKNWKRLSWIEDMLTSEDCSQYNTVVLLVAILRHPILELVYKAGYKNIFKMLIEDFTVTQNLKTIFGVAEKKKGSITKLLGCNKQTLKWFDEHYVSHQAHTYLYLISTIKEIFNTNDISSWSQESIEMYFKGAQTLLTNTSYNWKFNLQTDITSSWQWRRLENYDLTPEEQKRYQKILRNGSKNPQLIEILLDTLQTYRSLSEANRPNIDDIYETSSLSDIMRYHDAIVELHNQQEAERRARWSEEEKRRLEQDKKRFEKLQDERIKKYEYENPDDDFVIKVPHDLVEITNEGTALHHCVGGYLHRHAVGETNILFLRHKNLPTIPYYTIEVRNNHVVQIHGSCNQHLGAARDALKAIPFVQKWLAKTGIKCESNILLCTSTGYCMNNEFLDGAQFGLETL